MATVGRILQTTRHSLEQAVSRRLVDNIADAYDAVQSGVAEALRAGRVADEKVDGFVLYGRKPTRLADGYRFCWNEDRSYGWVIRRDEGRDLVITTISRAGVRF